MYIDRLTLTAIGIFIAVLMFTIRFCIFGLCGGPRPPDDCNDPRR